MLGLADRANPPRAVARAPPSVGSHAEGLVADGERAGPPTRLGEAHRVEEDAAVLPDVLTRLEEGGDRARPREVARDAVLARLEHEAEPLEALDHLDPERSDRGVHAVAQLTRRAHDVVASFARDA